MGVTREERNDDNEVIFWPHNKVTFSNNNPDYTV